MTRLDHERIQIESIKKIYANSKKYLTKEEKVAFRNRIQSAIDNLNHLSALASINNNLQFSNN